MRTNRFSSDRLYMLTLSLRRRLDFQRCPSDLPMRTNRTPPPRPFLFHCKRTSSTAEGRASVSRRRKPPRTSRDRSVCCVTSTASYGFDRRRLRTTGEYSGDQRSVQSSPADERPMRTNLPMCRLTGFISVCSVEMSTDDVAALPALFAGRASSSSRTDCWRASRPTLSSRTTSSASLAHISATCSPVYRHASVSQSVGQ